MKEKEEEETVDGNEASDDEDEQDLPHPAEEYDYPQIINKALPEDIRVLGWTPVPRSFNARFSATHREYKYFIVARQLDTTYTHLPPSSGEGDETGTIAGTTTAGTTTAGTTTAGTTEEGCYHPAGKQEGQKTNGQLLYDLDIEGMREAGQYLLGEHDFRNFCKHDVSGGVRSFVRHILSFSLDPVRTQAYGAHGSNYGCCSAAAATCATSTHPIVHNAICAAASEASLRDTGSVSTSSSPFISTPPPFLGLPTAGHQVFAFTIRGTAFLWHQIRCIMAVLLMVGQRRERPDVVKHLLDISKTPCKPQYAMASEAPLILFRCGFENLKFIRSPGAMMMNLMGMQAILARHLIAAAMTSAMVEALQDDYFGSEPGRSESASVRDQHRALMDEEEVEKRRQGDEGNKEKGGGSRESHSDESSKQNNSNISKNKSNKNNANKGGKNRGGGKGANFSHIPLLKRPTEPSVEERIQRLGLPPLRPWIQKGDASAVEENLE